MSKVVIFDACQEQDWKSRIKTSLQLFCANAVERLTNYTKEAVEHLILTATFYLLLCIFLYVGIVRWRIITFRRQITNPKKLLFVTAHPDDECMFFGPTILNYTKNHNCIVYLLCLSTGANYGMGKTRRKELYNACKLLGIDESCIMIKNHTSMPDSMDTKWPIDVVSEQILQFVVTYNIDTIITFDKYGVSQHLNHSSLYYGVAYLCIEKLLPKDCEIYVLESVCLIRKFWLILDIPLCYLLSNYRYLLNKEERSLIKTAMHEHKSQLVWFRRLYLLFSRYILINTLQKIDIVDVELDLDIDHED